MGFACGYPIFIIITETCASLGDPGTEPALIQKQPAMEMQARRSSDEGPNDGEEDNLSVTSVGVEGSSIISVGHLRHADLVSRDEGVEEDQSLQRNFAQHQQQAPPQVCLATPEWPCCEIAVLHSLLLPVAAPIFLSFPPRSHNSHPQPHRSLSGHGTESVGRNRKGLHC